MERLQNKENAPVRKYNANIVSAFLINIKITKETKRVQKNRKARATEPSSKLAAWHLLECP